MMTLEQMEKKATVKGNPIITQLINGAYLTVQRMTKSKHRRFSYQYNGKWYARDQIVDIIK